MYTDDEASAITFLIKIILFERSLKIFMKSSPDYKKQSFRFISSHCNLSIYTIGPS